MLSNGERYRIYFGDTIPFLFEMVEPDSVDAVITSVPFPSVFSYTNMECDLGNSEDLAGETRLHFSWFFRGLFRVMKPGRVATIHCMQFHRRRGNRTGIFDFRGFLIRVAERSGFVYDNDWLIWKNPQAEAVRTHAHGLLFVTLERDRSKSRAATSDYVIKLIKPGDNEVDIDSPGISREEWIEFASTCWHGIRQTNTLNTAEARGKEDVRHICALQLDLINRLIRLYSNPGEIVFDPFTGIGSTGYEAIKLGRRFLGSEIKQEYYDAAIRNLSRAERSIDSRPRSLLDVIEERSGDGVNDGDDNSKRSSMGGNDGDSEYSPELELEGV